MPTEAQDPAANNGGVHPSVHLYGALDNWQDCAVYWHERAGECARELNRVKDELRELKERTAMDRLQDNLTRRWRRR